MDDLLVSRDPEVMSGALCFRQVTSLALFGSTARDAAGAESDIDILVSFDGPATSDRLTFLRC